jgi:DNA-binding NtrC family response regulator
MNTKPTILCVDDEREITESLALALGGQYEIRTASSVVEARELLEASEFSVVVTDLNFHGQTLDGLSLIDWMRDNDDKTPVIVLSGDQDIRRVVAAQRRIVDDFIVKPFELPDLVCAIEKARSRATKAAPVPARGRPFEVLTQDRTILEGMEKIEKAMRASFDIVVLIRGESGSGKEVLARYASSIRGGQFQAVNMAAIPAELAESELFGHKKGAFTGAHSDKKGKFQAANFGTLFLDEIGDTELPIQVKLLRVLQEREVTPIGSNQPEKIDVKVLCATNQPLEKLCEEGKFRPELMHRIGYCTVEIPPLRKRRADIPLLVGKFLQEKSPRFRPASISSDALAALEKYDWPGNVRELIAVIEQALLAADFREIGVRHLPPHVLGIKPAPEAEHVPEDRLNLNFDARMRAEEIRLFNEALAAAGGKASKARVLMNMKKSTFYRKFADMVGHGEEGERA